MQTTRALPLLLLIDSNALAHRAFHAFPTTLATKKGLLVNAVYGFGSMLLQVLTTYKPDYLICAQDSKDLTFRHKLYEKYKAQRPPMDELMVAQMPLISELIESLNIPRIAMPGFEADDIIGSLVKSGHLKGLDTIIVTGDKDLFQVLDDNVKIYLPQSSFSNAVLYDKVSAVGKLGFEPDHMVDHKALRGDPSDNIPGVKGIGQVTATMLINKYHTLDNVYKNLDEIKPSIREKLIRDKKIAYISKDLGQIKTDIEIDMDIKNAKLENLNYQKFIDFCKEYDFYSLIKRISPLMNLPLEEPVNKFTFDNHKKNIGITKPDVQVYKAKIPETNRPQVKPGVTDETSYQQPTSFPHRRESVDRLLNATVIAYDTVLGPEPNLFSIPISLNFAFDDEVLIFPIKEIDVVLKDKLKKLFQQKKLVVYDAKKQAHALINLGFKLSEINFAEDLLISDYLLGAGTRQSTFEDSVGRVLNKKVEQKVQADLFDSASDYEHSHDILLLNSILTPQLEKEPKLLELKDKIELPLVKVLVELERNGIRLDSDYLIKFTHELDSEIAKLSKEIFEIAGVEFNLSSPKQLGEVLSQKLKLPVVKKTKGGSISTNEKVLLNYVKDYPVIALILQYRELFKLKSTYTTTLISEINSKTGRIHSTFNQALVATGRLSSKNPNLQNIPTGSELGQKIRSAFVAEKGKILVSFDYSQQELRILAHLSQENKLLDVFRNKIDIHSATASVLFNVPVTEVTKKQRRVGKTVNFGVIYGISGFGLGDRLKISTEAAQKFINNFYSSYPKVKIYFEKSKADARNTGFLETMYGRRKDASGLNNPNFQARMGNEREVINFPLQGSAADIMKLAMIKVSEYLDGLNDERFKMVLQIHDELIFEIPDDTKYMADFISKVKNIMMSVCELDIPLEVEANYAKSWGNLK